MPIQRLYKQPPPNPKPPPTEPARPRASSYWWKVGVALTLTLIGFVGLLGYRLLAAVNTTTDANKRVSVFTQLGRLVANRDAELDGESAGRINILLLGIGGAGHEGPLLADTIILASVKSSTGQIALLSIPRDLAVEIPRYGIRKINNANAFGKDVHYPGGGEQLTADLVEKITGQSIHYFARIDFSGFEEIIDTLGGMTVSVERGFVDRQYPTEDFGVQTIRFNPGEQTMDGATALKFVRSRHGSNGEGSDFARSHRQQLVLEAIRDKVFSIGTILNPVKVGSVLSSLGSNTRTNLELWELLRLGKIVRNAETNETISRVLESGPNGPLKEVTGIDGAFLLLPKDGTFDTVKTIARNIFLQPELTKEAARISIADATGRFGTAKTFADKLESLGLHSPIVQTPAEPLQESSRIYDYSRGSKIATLHLLETTLGVRSISNLPPLLDPRQLVNSDDLQNINIPAPLPPQPKQADILIVLGKDYTKQLISKKAFSPS